MMRMVIAALAAFFVLATSAHAQDDSGGHWVFNGEYTLQGFTGSTGSQVMGYFPSHAQNHRIAVLIVRNVSNSRRSLRIVSTQPGPDDDQVSWFNANFLRGMSDEPGSQGEIAIVFVGRRGGATEHAEDGAHDGILVLEDTADGTRYEISLTAIVYSVQ